MTVAGNSSGHPPILSSSSHTLPESFFLSVGEENDNIEECECVKRMASKKPLYVRQLPIIFTPSHTCTVSFFLLVGEENDNFDECACVKRMETPDIEQLAAACVVGTALSETSPL